MRVIHALPVVESSQESRSHLSCLYADDIYREDVVFKDPRNTVKGKKNYKRIFRGLSLLGRLAFTRCR